MSEINICIENCNECKNHKKIERIDGTFFYLCDLIMSKLHPRYTIDGRLMRDFK